MNQFQARQMIKQLLLRVAPQMAGAWQDRRHRRHIRLLGSYESELHGVIEQVLATGYDVVVDVGCAEGYYANGIARRLPSAHVFAFDTDPEARQLCEAMAALNGVQGRVTFAGKCEPGDLNALLKGRSLIICDCEGFETELLRPDLVPAMAQADVLVELHDHVKPGITPLLLSRFEATHQAILINVVARDPADYPMLRFSAAKSRQLAVSEFRPSGQQWAVLKPRLVGEAGP